MNYTHIVSPTDGRVGIRFEDPGNYLQPSDATGIVVVTELNPISVIFSTAEDNLPRIAERLNSGATIPVTAFNRANVDKLAEGTLTAYDSQVDITTGTIKMRATFDNPKGVLFPQQFVNVRLLIDTLKGVALAPNAAVQIGPTGHFVYLLNADDTVTKRDVVTGPSDGKSTTITSGLAAADKVVIDGVDRLRDGAKVRVVAGAGDAVASASGEARRHRRGEEGSWRGRRLREGSFPRGEGDLRRGGARVRVCRGSADVCEGEGRRARQGGNGSAGDRARERRGSPRMSCATFVGRGRARSGRRGATFGRRGRRQPGTMSQEASRR